MEEYSVLAVVLDMSWFEPKLDIKAARHRPFRLKAALDNYRAEWRYLETAFAYKSYALGDYLSS